jgi:hypothetical protein
MAKLKKPKSGKQRKKSLVGLTPGFINLRFSLQCSIKNLSKTHKVYASLQITEKSLELK